MEFCKRILKVSFYFIGVALFIGCKNDHELLEGHWHLKYVDKQKIELLNELDTGIENTIDYKEQSGQWNADMAMSFPLGVYIIDNLENSLTIRAVECYAEDFFYEIRKNTLLLKDSFNTVIYKGMRCVDDCCSKEDDYFLKTNLSIELPILKETIVLEELNTIPLSAYLYDKIYFGKSTKSNKYKLKYGFSEYEKLSLKDWITEIENRHYFKEKKQHQIFAFLDKQSPLDSVKVILNDLKNSGIKELIIVGKETEEFKFQFKKISTDVVILNDETSLQSWISKS